MIEFNIPGRGNLAIEHLAMDVNGTLTVDGNLIDGVAERIGNLRNHLTIHHLTADTYSGQAAHLLPDILSALDLFQKPLRVIASLRR